MKCRDCKGKLEKINILNNSTQEEYKCSSCGGVWWVDDRNRHTFEETFYFIVYKWRKLDAVMPNHQYENVVTDLHPLGFLKECRDANEEYVKQTSNKPGPPKFREEYILLNWKEISEEMYDKYKDVLE